MVKCQEADWAVRFVNRQREILEERYRTKNGRMATLKHTGQAAEGVYYKKPATNDIFTI